MADNTVNVGINVSDKGTTGKVTQNVKELKNLLDQAAQSAAKLAMSGGTPAPTMAGGGSVPPSGGGRAAITSGGGARPPGGAASAQAEYGAMRGVAGSTGASARDFAKEAEGMSGLVRVYAAFAATTYAVAAAFSALSKAMDTSNMVQGLNQLGAASGVSLGNLSKRLVDTTEGAISLRQAMQSVAQASAAGISSANILKMGDVAKKASQALGIDMSDALSRISRGVTKLEPELLDELGIFTKLNESNAKYAVTLGKSVGALTDFEKRQGFANAVIDEATKKFGDLKIDANPYSKLLATFQNLAQTGLELVNKVVAPIVGLLSSSPMALAGVLTYIGINLLSKTIPAIGRWQEGLKDAAEQAKITSESVAKSFDTRFQTNLESRFKLPGLKQSLAESEKEFAKLSATALVGPMAAAPKNLGPNATTAGMDSKGLSTINDLLATRNTRLETGYAGAAKMSATQVHATKDEVKWLEAKARAIEQEIALTAAAGKVSKDKAAIDTAQTKIGTIADKKIGPFDPQTIGLKQAEKARINYEKLSAVAAASEMASTNGVRAAWVQLGDTIKEKGITGIDKFTTLAKGGLAAVGTRLTGIISAFGVWGQIAAAGVAIFEVLDSFASKNAKEAEATSKAFSVVTDAVTTLGDTMDVIAKKDALGQISTESRNASATAINGLIAATKDALDKAGKEILAANWWDILKDKVSMLWGGDVASKSIKATADAITKALSAAEEGGAKNKALGDLKILLGGDLPKTAEELEKKLKSLDKSMGGEALKIIDTMGQSIQKVASEAMELDEAFKNASKTFDSIVISALPTDPIAKLGQEYMIAGEKMATAIKDPTTALEQLAKVSGDTSKLKMFSPELAADLVKNSDKIKENAAIVKAYTQVALDAQAKIDAPPARVRRGTERAGLVALGRETSDEEQKNIKAAATNAVTTASAVIDPFLKKMAAESAAMMEKGAKFIQNSIAKGFAEGRAILSAVYAARLGDTEAGIKARAQLAKEEINRSIKDIEAKKGLVDSQEALRKAVEENTIEIALSTLERSKLSEKDKTEQAKQLNMAKDRLKLSAVDYATKYKEEVPKGPTAAQLAIKALDSQIFKLRQSAAAIDLKTQDELAANASRHTVEQLDANNKIAASRKELNKLIEQGLPYVSEETLKAQQIIDIQVEQNSALKESKVIRDKIATSERTIADLTTKRKYGPNDARDMENALAARKEDTKELALLEQTQAEQKITNDRKRVEEFRTGAANRFTFEQTLVTRSLEIAQSKDKIQAADKEATIVKLKDAGVNAAIILANFQSDLDKKTERERSAATLAGLQRQRDAEIKAKTDIVEKTTVGTPERGIAEQDLKSVTARYDALISGEKAVSASKQISLDIAARQSLEMATQAKLLADQKTAMDALVPVAESLSTIFGDVGKKFGDGMLGILKATQDAANARVAIDLKYAQDKKAIEIQMAADIAAAQDTMAPDMGASAELKGKKELATLEQKNAKDSANLEFAKNAKMISSFKNMFSEKTFAYKALANVEKVMHISKLAMEAKEMAMSLFADGKKLFSKIFTAEAGAAATVSATVVEMAAAQSAAAGEVAAATPSIFAKFSSQMGVWGWAAAAAVVAAIAGMGGGGGSTPAPPAGFKAEEQQKVQGTGQQYVDGKLVDRAGGVLGDPTAIADSIKTSMEELGKVFFDNLGSGSSSIIKYLKGIEEATSETAKALIGTGLLGGSAAAGINKSSKGFLGFSSESTTLEDAGIKIISTIGELILGKGDISGYLNITTSSSSFWGLISDSVSESVPKDVPEEVKTKITDIFKNVSGALIASGIALEGTGDRVANVISEIPVKFTASSMGLSASEFADKLLSEISVSLNAAAIKAFPYMEQYTKAGEEMYETVARIIKDGETLQTGLNMLGKGFKGISTLRSFLWLSSGISAIEDRIAKEQVLLKEFDGDRDLFATSIQFYFDNFKTIPEQLQYSVGVLAKGFADIGIPAVTTKKEFDNLVNSLDVTTASGAKLFAQLLKLAPVFEKVNAQYEDLIKQVAEINSESATKFLSESEKLIFTRNKEREVIIETNKPLFDMITALQLASLNLNSAGQALQDGYKKVVSEADKAKAALLSVAEAGLATLETEAKTLRTTLATLATSGVRLLEAAVTDAKTKLKDLIFNGFGLLTTKLTGLQGELQALGTTGFATLTQEVSKVKDSIKASYKTAVDAQKSANKAFIDSLKTVGTGIKDFLKTVASGDLGITDQATKYKALRTEFDKTLAAAKSGDEVALGKLPQISQDLLTAAKEQASTKVQYARTFAEVTSQLGDISAVLDAKVQTAEQSAADGVAALELSTLSTADALKAANEELAKWTDTIQRSGVVVEIDTEANTATKLSTASGALDALTTAQTNLNDWLDLIGTDSASLLTKVNPTTITELKESFETIRTNIADVNTTINTYIKDNNEILKTAGYTGDDLLKNLPVTLTVDNTKAQIDALVGIVKGAEVALTVYIAGTTTFLENNGFSTANIDKILARTDTPLTKANTQDKLDEAVARVDASEAAITAYIARTNTVLVAAGFGEDDLLKRTKILTLDAAIDSASLAFDTAVIEVDKWAAKLEELGISFTPYGETNDVGLETLVGKFTVAKTAFDNANKAITDWVTRMTVLASSITVPVIEPIIKADTTFVGTPPAKTGPTGADDYYYMEYVRHVTAHGTMDRSPAMDYPTWLENDRLIKSADGKGGYALGGVFDSGSKMAFASGGAFSNSIVDTPTKFRMGLMGEAGPEAIMPLTRGPDGSLGVTAQMPNFSNNSNEANMVLVNEIKELRNEVAKLRVIAGQNEYNTRKTKETLQLVTVGGEYMQTKTVT